MTNYHGYKEGWFRIASGTTLRAGDKRWQVISAEGIDLDQKVYPKDDVEFVTHYVLNFPAIDQSLQTVDFYESDDPKTYILYDIALTDQAAEKIKQRIAIPGVVKNYAANIKDNGESLEKNDFTFETAVVKGKIYGFDKRFFGEKSNPEIGVYFYNPFFAEQVSFTAKIQSDGTYEIHVPMTTKHQAAYLIMRPMINNTILLSAGKTVTVDYDFQQVYKPWELPNGLLTPYFSGENVDINYAYTKYRTIDMYGTLVANPNTIKDVANFTMPQYKDYVFKNFEDFNTKVDTMQITKRAKEVLKIELKSEQAYYLSMGFVFIESAYRMANGIDYREPIPDFNSPEMTEDYLDYAMTLGLDDMMMFYANGFGYNICGWNICRQKIFYKSRYEDTYYALLVNLIEKLPSTVKKMPKKEKPLAAALAQKIRTADTSRTPEERIFEKKYIDAVFEQINGMQKQEDENAKSALNKYLGNESLFKDFITLQEYCQPLGHHAVVEDSLVKEIEKMRLPFYAEYVKAQNAEITAQIEAEKKRGGYYVHKAGDSEGDSLFVELIKDFKGKVVLIDFWNTWCGPCRSAIKQMEPMEKDYQDKDVVFLFVADESSPENEYDGMIVSMKGHHYRLTDSQQNSLKRKWGFTGIPSYVIIGKDGDVKDFHTGFQGAEYYKQKIDEELKK